MTLHLNDKFVRPFVARHELEGMRPALSAAYHTLMQRDGAGNDFLGWIDLPVNYDKEEFARIKLAAEKIKKTCDVLVVLGIGGSYLGARAAVEFVKSPPTMRSKRIPRIFILRGTISARMRFPNCFPFARGRMFVLTLSANPVQRPSLRWHSVYSGNG